MAVSMKTVFQPCSSPFCHRRLPSMLHQRSRLHKAERQSINRHGRSRTEVRAADGDPPEGFKEKPAASAEEATKGIPAGVPKLEKGQGTAIVTGAVSIIFGVLYLVLIQLLDTRGTQLEPPPPEAFGL